MPQKEATAGPRSFASVCRSTELSPYLVRHYEREGLIGPVERDRHGWRRYSDGDIERLTRIARWRSEGLELEDMRALLAHGAEGIRRRIRHHAARTAGSAGAIRVLIDGLEPRPVTDVTAASPAGASTGGAARQVPARTRELVTYRRYELVNADGTPYGAADPRSLGGGLWFDTLREVRDEIAAAAQRSDPSWDPYGELTVVEVAETQRVVATGGELRRLVDRV